LPEETNRRIVDIISDVNMAYSEHARRYLAECGLPKERTYVTGSPMAEVLHENLEKIMASDIHARLGLEKGNYILLSAHREENIAEEKHFFGLVEALNEVAKNYKLPIIVSTHPRTRKMIEAKGVKFDKLVRLMKPMGLTDYLALQLNAKAVLSDSGTISEESSILGFKALNLREAHERPEAMEEAAVMMVGLNKDRILQGLAQLVKCGKVRQVADYSMPNVGEKVVKIIISYVDYIKRRVWCE
jgi:UDP-N-acetylglucosamine 2-epimerase (non-hydrolysing)